jgi:hypothetical protein
MPIGGRNVLLIAGNDVNRAETIFNKAKARLGEEGVRWRDADRIAEIVFEECNTERDRIIEASILRKRGFNWKMFREGGKTLCTDAVYYEIASEIADVKLSLDCLIAGFDEDDKPHIRFTNWETPPENYDQLGFYAIGTGAHAAMNSLAHAVEYLNFGRKLKISEVVYHVLAAKFMSESAQDVGQDTLLVVGGHGVHDDPNDKDILFFSVFAGVDFVREKWETEGGPKIPKGIATAIGELLVKPEEVQNLDALRKAAKHSAKARKILRRFERAYEQYQAKERKDASLSASQKSEPEQ